MNPNNDIWRSKRVWAVATAAFLVMGLMSSAQTYMRVVSRGHDSFTWALALSGDMPFYLANLVTFPLVVWAVHRVPLLGRNWKWALLFHLAFSVVHGGLKLMLGTAMAHPMIIRMGPRMPFLDGIQQVLLQYYVSGITMYWAMVGVVLAVDYYRYSREREQEAAQAEIRAARLETSLERARLDWLRSQLNPHFLFNTLNSVSSLARQQRTETVVATLARLGDLLRATLRHSSSIVPLESEIELLEKYLDIERLRFGDRLTITLEIDPVTRSAAVPSLILQPLVENALKHGLGGMRGPVSVVISAAVERSSTLVFEVSDSGYGFREGWEEGVGLANTRSRLAQLYGDTAELAVLPREHGATVRVRLPLTLAEAEPEPHLRGGVEPLPAPDVHSAHSAS